MRFVFIFQLVKVDPTEIYGSRQEGISCSGNEVL